jgi:hypothetical protein
MVVHDSMVHIKTAKAPKEAPRSERRYYEPTLLGRQFIRSEPNTLRDNSGFLTMPQSVVICLGSEGSVPCK